MKLIETYNLTEFDSAAPESTGGKGVELEERE
jgi:hypothetical protein